jgi:DNA-binding NtrC family response regulator/tetratricopeptide (TPR) repeat protein
MDSPLESLRGEHPKIVAIRRQIEQLLSRHRGGRRFAPILILGETGTGKGLLARAIHQAGPRRRGPFTDVNCAAIPETLLEAELFGYERGAFTDARQPKPGLFQTAHGGTLFLDEIGLLPGMLQGKLLTVIEDGAVRRLGGTQAERVDVALIAATSVDLPRAVADGGFRGDLYHRLAVIVFELPRLRERGGDILPLAEHFLAHACTDYLLAPRTLAPDARDLLMAYPWPGNVRELANAMERVALLSDGDVIAASMLDFLTGTAPHARDALPEGSSSDAVGTGSLDDAVRARIQAALRDHDGGIRRTAQALGISRNSLRARMDRYGLRRPVAAVAARNVPAPPAVAPAPSRPVRWERRYLAFLRARFLPSSAADVARGLDVVHEKALAFGGRIEESGPMGAIVVFGLEPVDNAPSHAALAALAIQNAVAHHRGTSRATGEVVIAIDCDHHVVGYQDLTSSIAVDGKAATWSVLEDLVAVDRPGAIAVTEAVAPFLTRRFALERLIDSRRNAWRLVRREESPAARTRFVGRSAELDMLRQSAMRAERHHGQIVSVVGVAGVGKSRLIDELIQCLQGWHVLSAGGAAYARNTPYFALIELIKQYCDIREADAASDVRAKLAASLPREAGDPGPPIANLLGVLPADDAFLALDPPIRRRRIQDAIKQVLFAATTAQPLCLVVEDLHWVDSETQAVLDMLAEAIPASSILVLTSYRPEYHHGWGRRSYYTQVALDVLAPENVEELFGALLGTDATLEDLKRLLADRTGGNPFFIEECVRSLVETRVLVGQAGQYRRGQSRDVLAAPPTVEAAIATRIERLSDDERTVLRSAAVIGNDVRVAILRSVSGLSDDAFERILGGLRQAEFMYETRVHPELEYRFNHALTREVAFRGVPEQPRRVLHARIVAAIEAVYPDRLLEHAERLASHASDGEVWDKAVEYGWQAGAKAAAHSVHREAVAFFEHALGALQHLPESRARTERAIDLRCELRNSLLVLREGAGLLEHLRTAERLAESLGDRRRLGRVTSYMTRYFSAEGDFDQALACGRRALDIGDALEDAALQVETRFQLGREYYILGEYRAAMPLFAKNVEALQGDLRTKRFGLPFVASAGTRSWLVRCLAEQGEFADGMAHADEAVRIAEASDDALSLADARYCVGYLCLLRGDFAGAVAALERSIALVRSGNLRIIFSGTAAALGVAYARCGRLGQVLPLLEQVAKESDGERASQWMSLLSEAYLLAGQRDEALALTERALKVSDRRQRSFRGSVLQLRGEIALRRESPDAEEADAAYREALALATELGMRPLQAHCHLGLGRIGARRGQRAQAQAHLSAAVDLYRAMNMTFWLPEVESARSRCRDRSSA